MISDALAHEILRLYGQEKWSPGTIARQLRLHRSVVQRVLRQAGSIKPLVQPMHSKLAIWLPMIEEILGKYPGLCASSLFQMAVERGHRGSADHFRHYVSQHRPRKPAEAYIRLRTLPGEEGQVDWAHFGKVKVGRAERRLVGFVLVLSYSRRIFLRFGFDQGMAGFLDGHRRAFEHFGGIPRVLLYDNLKSAVVERIGNAIKMHPTMLDFASWHGYEPRPVGVARGNEKGRVERSIGYIRTSFFAAREWTSLDDLNAQALAWCDGLAAERLWPQDRTRKVREMVLEEQPLLLPLPADRFPCEDRLEVHSAKTPYIRYDLNDYSVPHTLVQRTLWVHATPTRVRVLDGSTVVAEHVRSYDKAKVVEDPAHLAALARHKKEARHHRAQDRLIAAVPQVHDILVQLGKRGQSMGTAVQHLVKLFDSYGVEDFTQAVSQALTAGTPHPNNIRLLCERLRNRRGLPEPLSVPVVTAPHLRGLHVRPHSVHTYDRLSAVRSKPKKESDDE